MASGMRSIEISPSRSTVASMVGASKKTFMVCWTAAKFGRGATGFDARRKIRAPAIGADLAGPHQAVERVEDRDRRIGRRGIDVELIEIDALAPKPPERCLDGDARMIRGEVLPGHLLRRLIEDRPELGGDNHVVAIAEGFAEQRLGMAGSVDGGGIEEADAAIGRAAEQVDRVAVVDRRVAELEVAGKERPGDRPAAHAESRYLASVPESDRRVDHDLLSPTIPASGSDGRSARGMQLRATGRADCTLPFPGAGVY